jgi:hypothetical protein
VLEHLLAASSLSRRSLLSEYLQRKRTITMGQCPKCKYAPVVPPVMLQRVLGVGRGAVGHTGRGQTYGNGCLWTVVGQSNSLNYTCKRQKTKLQGRQTSHGEFSSNDKDLMSHVRVHVARSELLNLSLNQFQKEKIYRFSSSYFIIVSKSPRGTSTLAFNHPQSILVPTKKMTSWDKD